MKSLSPAAVLALILFPAPAFAQVNTEAMRGDADRQGWSGRVEARFTGSTGNSEGIVAGGSGRVQFLREAHLGFVHAAGSYTRLNQTTSVERSLVHGRYNYELAPWVWAEAFVQLEHDAFRRLTNRELLGIGPRFRVVDRKDIDVFVGTSYLAEWENLDRAHADSGDSLAFAHRWNNYVKVSAQGTERLELGATVYLQPRFDKLSDFRLLAESFLEVGITDVVSVKLSATLRHDSEPPVQVKTTDFALTNAFVAKF